MLGLVELDEREDGGQIQSTLRRLTGISTVPQVFIGGTCRLVEGERRCTFSQLGLGTFAGQCVGGGDDTAALARSGKLVPLLRAAGVACGSDR